MNLDDNLMFKMHIMVLIKILFTRHEDNNVEDEYENVLVQK